MARKNSRSKKQDAAVTDAKNLEQASESGLLKGASINIDTKSPPFDTNELRRLLKEFLSTSIEDPDWPKIKRIGGYKFGVYAFYDYDGEPIYVGQTRELLSGRIGRHLTNQRTDAVAMNVLDPYEVFEVEIWPLRDLQGKSADSKEARKACDDLEHAIYNKLIKESSFSAILNEKAPPKGDPIEIPRSFRGRIVSDDVLGVRGHPDTRIARRAMTIARLAQVISEREVNPGLRRTLVTQARRITWLAERRFKPFEEAAKKQDEQKRSKDEQED